MAQSNTLVAYSPWNLSHPSLSPVCFPQFVGDIKSLKDCPLQVLKLAGGSGFPTEVTGMLWCQSHAPLAYAAPPLTLSTFLGTYFTSPH